MKRKLIYNTGLVVILIACLGFIGSSVTAGARQYNKFNKISMEELNKTLHEGQAFSVNPTEAFFVVNQIKIHVVENLRLRSGEVISTVIIDENGNRMLLSQLKNFQRVRVEAYTTRENFTFASKIKRVPLRPGDPTKPSAIPQ